MKKLTDVFKTDSLKQKRKILSKFELSRDDKNGLLTTKTNGGGSVSKYAPRYFKIDWNVASKDWESVLSLGNVDSTINVTNIIMNIGATFKRSIHLDNGKAQYITAYPFFNLDKDDDYSFSYNPLYIEQSILDALNIEAKGGIMNFEDIIKISSNYFSIVFNRELNLSMEGITEITEDEYYKID